MPINPKNRKLYPPNWKAMLQQGAAALTPQKSKIQQTGLVSIANVHAAAPMNLGMSLSTDLAKSQKLCIWNVAKNLLGLF